jgi:hypothetical protein
MTKQTVQPIMARVALVSACVLYLAGCVGSIALGPDSVKGQTPDGAVEMQEVQAAYIGSGSAGTGILFFRGVQYPFEVGGLGVGGLGLSTIPIATPCTTSARGASRPGSSAMLLITPAMRPVTTSACCSYSRC